MRLKTMVNNVSVEIDLPGITKSVYERTQQVLSRFLCRSGTKNRDAIAEAYLFVLRKSKGANASDLWHHVVYRLYCSIFNKYRHQDPKQSWVRASGDALEIVLEKLYAPVLAPRGIVIRALVSLKAKRRALEDFGIAHLVGASKLDLALYTSSGRIFAGVHVKASLAERVSDDVPCSRALIQKGFWSPLWTLDVKSFPPPTGNLINRGELGSPSSPSDKRKYIESHGDFDNCYSANSRTVASEGPTASGKRIYTLDLLDQPDQFALHAIAEAQRQESA